MVKNNKLLIFSGASALFHGLIVGLFIILSTLVPDNFDFDKPSGSFKVEKISSSDLDKIRRAGIKDGSIVNNSPNYLKTSPGDSKKVAATKYAKKSLSLKDLATQKVDTKNIQKTVTPQKAKLAKSGFFRISPQSQMLNQRMHQEVEGQNQNAHNSIPGYFGKDVYSHIVPPKGISPDEFNTLEKTFYGFRRREISTFYSTLYKKFNESIIRHPQLKEALKGKDRTTLRVIRDSEGNLVSIKVMRAAISDDIHDFMLNVFKAIPKIQNVPKELLDDGEYQVYWDIKVNPHL